jgi:peptidoglycan/xylan/chitin deacetylase (PgdA/CDA1 family)
VLRDLKLGLLRTARAAGAFRLLRDSGWRARQLLILCYHGISIDDEHQWAPGLYMPADQFRRRLEQLRDARSNVLPLGEAVRRLHEGTLPPRSVAITFDDGNYDFYRRAWPVLRDFGFPVTVYLTTYYAEHELPVFPLAVGYVLWKGARAAVRFRLGDRDVSIDTRTEAGRRRARDLVQLHAQDMELSTVEKDALVERLAMALGVDYAAVRERRLLQIMNGDEARELAAAGVDFELHTHRHRSPLDEVPYRAEIADNRERIVALTGTRPAHFCYPSGVCMPQFAPWLAAEGVRTATTCEPGMATRASSALALPRLLDHSEMTELEFDSWLAGLGAVLPRRAVGFTPVNREGHLIIPRVEEPQPLAPAR